MMTIFVIISKSIHSSHAPFSNMNKVYLTMESSKLDESFLDLKFLDLKIYIYILSLFILEFSRPMTWL